MTIYNYPDIMTSDDICSILNISKNHCLYLLKSQQIKGFKINNSRAWRITKPALREFLKSAKA